MNDLDIESIRLMNNKLQAESIKLQAETEKLRRKSRYYPVLVGAGLMAAATGLAGVVLKLFSA